MWDVKNIISSKYINNEEKIKEKEGLTLEENDYQVTFLGAKHHLFKRFCKRNNNNIYIFNFIGFENNYAIFECENKTCNAIYCYNFSSNKFIKRKQHCENSHKIIKDAPNYYHENIKLLKEKEYITDIQLIKVDD